MSTLQANDISDLTGIGPVELVEQWAARVFYSYDQIDSSLDKSGGVSSLSDNAVGDFDVSFTSAWLDVNYAVTSSAGCRQSASVHQANGASSCPYSGNVSGAFLEKTTALVRMNTINGAFSARYDHEGNGGVMNGEFAA